MFSQKAKNTPPTPQQLSTFVMNEMKKTADLAQIQHKVEQQFRMTTEDAKNLVEQTAAVVEQQAEKEQLEGHDIPMAIIGGILAAIVGGGVWAAIAYFTEYEVGYIAIGVGILAGYAVVWLSHGKKGFILQIIAIISSLLAIGVGKYFTVFFLVKKLVAEQYSSSVADSISFFSADFWNAFNEVFWQNLSPYDALWVILAVYSAWKIPQAFKVRPKSNLA